MRSNFKHIFFAFRKMVGSYIGFCRLVWVDLLEVFIKMQGSMPDYSQLFILLLILYDCFVLGAIKFAQLMDILRGIVLGLLSWCSH